MSNWTLFTWQYVQVLAYVALACLVGLWLFIYHCVSSALRKPHSPYMMGLCSYPFGVPDDPAVVWWTPRG